MALTTTRSKKPAHIKKVSGNHHRKSKQYVKAYWPYIPMFFIVAGGIALSNAWSHQAVLGTQSDFSAQTLLDDTNAQRAADHEAALSIDPKLQAAAEAKAKDMATKDYWAHTSPSGETPWTFIQATGYQYQSAGENLAYGFANAGDTITGWMNSPEHRANILDSAYQNVGFGVVSVINFLNKGPTIIIVAEYAQPATSVAHIQFTVDQPTNSPAQTPAQAEPTSTSIPHLALVSNREMTGVVAAVSALTGFAAALFVLRHGLRIHRLLVKGEHYVAKHPLLDIAVVFVATTGSLFLHSAGFVR